MIVRAPEGAHAVLQPSHSGRLTSCTEKNWFRYDGKHNFPRIAHLDSDNSQIYYGKFCFKNSDPCMKSQKLELDTFTGDLIVHNLELADEDDYYYFCGVKGQWPIYQLIKLDVYGMKLFSVILIQTYCIRQICSSLSLCYDVKMFYPDSGLLTSTAPEIFTMQ